MEYELQETTPAMHIQGGKLERTDLDAETVVIFTGKIYQGGLLYPFHLRAFQVGSEEYLLLAKARLTEVRRSRVRQGNPRNSDRRISV